MIIGKIQRVPPTVGIFLKSLCRRVFFLFGDGILIIYIGAFLLLRLLCAIFFLLQRGAVSHNRRVIDKLFFTFSATWAHQNGSDLILAHLIHAPGGKPRIQNMIPKGGTVQIVAVWVILQCIIGTRKHRPRLVADPMIGYKIAVFTGETVHTIVGTAVVFHPGHRAALAVLLHLIPDSVAPNCHTCNTHGHHSNKNDKWYFAGFDSGFHRPSHIIGIYNSIFITIFLYIFNNVVQFVNYFQ